MTNSAPVVTILQSASVNSTRSRTTVLRDVLACTLPSPEQSLLLEGCLGSGRIASTAWSDWLNRVRDPKSVFENDRAGLKGLLPFVRHSLDANGIEVSEEFRVYLQVSSVREELRSNIYRKILGNTLSALRAAGCDVITLRGAALSETVYEKASIRHNHAIELLVHSSQVQTAIHVLKELPFKLEEARRPWQRHAYQYIHETGLPLVLHTRLLLLPHYSVSLDEIWTGSQPAILGDVETKVLSPVDTVMHVCGHASYSYSRMNLRWVCDAVLTLRRYPEMDWDRVSERVRQYRLVLPLGIMFEYLANRLHAPIPEKVLSELSCAAARTDSTSREAAIAGFMMGAGSPFRAIRLLRGDSRAQMLIVRFLILPSRIYMRWRYGIEGFWLLSFVYLYRPLKFMLRPVRIRGVGPKLARNQP